MTTNHDAHGPRAALPDDPALLHSVFAAAFNSGDSRAVDLAYEDRGVLVPAPGQPMTGPARVGAVEHLLRLGLPIDARTRHVYTADDIALLVVDWSIRGTARDGSDVHLEGTAADVARRGRDGLWRYVIDNPFGTA
ncbi:ketosteroid isomerase-like protein [Spinactinospora alkalitolerans]|uniref:Ketosteroid isomerase-like protein n=1 Tax=Spinactinospora alkalitolerans TaxID=687207 RepID=A0A852U8W1_9ACTN|nr:nuclear transport factor 2 family protein [Spinactinospora alkalitolerans]NYE50370.1 ketosteroid isomerase-like protein [Spinactinospora alkalitolerans]